MVKSKPLSFRTKFSNLKFAIRIASYVFVFKQIARAKQDLGKGIISRANYFQLLPFISNYTSVLWVT